MSENELLIVVICFAFGIIFLGFGIYGLYEFHGGQP